MRQECLGCGGAVNGGGDLFLVLKGYQVGTTFTAEIPDGYLCSGCRKGVEDLGEIRETLKNVEASLPTSEKKEEGKQQSLGSRIGELLERLIELETSGRPPGFPIEINV